MCRTFCDGLFQVTRHAGRNHRCALMRLSDNGGHFGQPVKRRPGRSAKRRHGHHAAKRQAVFCADRVCQGGHLAGRRSAALRQAGVPTFVARCVMRLVEIDLNEARDIAAYRPGPRSQHLDEPGTVNGMDHVRVPDDALGLSGLELTDEMPAQRRFKAGALGGLGRCLLIAVLADVQNALARPAVLRQGLETSRDRDQRHREVPARRFASRGDPFAALPDGTEFFFSGRITAHQVSHMRPANRPVVPFLR